MNRLKVEREQSLIGHPDTWMVREHCPSRGWSVVFRGTYCECVKYTEKLGKPKAALTDRGP
jgi:hypothetical protein